MVFPNLDYLSQYLNFGFNEIQSHPFIYCNVFAKPHRFFYTIGYSEMRLLTLYFIMFMKFTTHYYVYWQIQCWTTNLNFLSDYINTLPVQGLSNLHFLRSSIIVYRTWMLNFFHLLYGLVCDIFLRIESCKLKFTDYFIQNFIIKKF